jgi:hypothetical protein
MNTNLPEPSDRRNGRLSIVVGAALASGAIAVTLGIGGTVRADDPPITLPPGVTVAPTNPPIATIPGGLPTTNPPVITIPGGLPTTNPPVITLPGGLPTTSVPFVTLPPGVTLVPTSTVTPADPGNTDPTGTADPADPADPAGTEAADPGSSEAGTPGSGPDAEPVEPYLEITSAAVDCAGLVHVEYETGANPEPAETTEHMVMVSPVDDPATVVTQRLVEQATNGQFVLDIPTSAVPQRIVIVADFEPANPEGIILVDEANAVPADDCPVTTG